MRGFIVVLDSFGVGAAPDATAFGDEGASTIKTISKSVYFNTPNMKKMGLLAIDGVGLDSLEKHNASYGRLRELSIGKDTTTGHWEMAGIVSKKALPTFPNGFPSEVIAEFEKFNMDEYEEVVFCGFGEPTERFDVLIKVAEYVKKTYGKKTRINTNGVGNLVNGRDIVPEMEGLIDTISISLNNCLLYTSPSPRDTR